MVLLFPLPGWVASKIQTIQVEKMKKTDIRVQSVTECEHFAWCMINTEFIDVVAMNVIRMIKLFGWEPRVKQQLTEKREDELYYQWKYRLMGLINACLKYVRPMDYTGGKMTSVQLYHPFGDDDSDVHDICEWDPEVRCLRSHPRITFQTLIMRRELTASAVFSTMSGRSRVVLYAARTHSEAQSSTCSETR